MHHRFRDCYQKRFTNSRLLSKKFRWKFKETWGILIIFFKFWIILKDFNATRLHFPGILVVHNKMVWKGIFVKDTILVYTRIMHVHSNKHKYIRTYSDVYQNSTCTFFLSDLIGQVLFCNLLRRILQKMYGLSLKLMEKKKFCDHLIYAKRLSTNLCIRWNARKMKK